MKTETNPIILFDGVCNFCDASVNYIIKSDSDNQFRFAPLQSEIAMELTKKYGINKEETDSVVLIENDKVYTYSTAVLRIAKNLGGIKSLIYGFILVPKVIRDFFL